MSVIRVIDPRGMEHEVEAQAGQKVMEILRELDYGIAAVCGGMCSCATCHIYVDPQWAGKLMPPTSDECDLLSELVHARPESRLSCQMEFTEALAGLCITIAPGE